MDNKLDKIPTKLLLTLVFLLLASIIFLLRLRQKPQTVEASWWNELWHYRNYITVTNNTSQEYNVYTTLSIGTSAIIASGKMQSDCGDLRFTNSFGNLLDYYIVSGCNTSSTSINVNHTTLSPGVQLIYFYYGNSTTSNGTQASNFSTQATNYTVGSTSTEEKGTAPIAHYRFNEGIGQTTANSISGQPDISIPILDTGITAVSWSDQSISGKSLSFGGQAVARQVSFSPSFEYWGTGGITISAWIYTNASESGGGYIISKPWNGSGYYNWYLKYNATGTISFQLRGDQSSTLTTTDTVAKDEWHHIVATADNDNSFTIYIDGNLSTSGAWSISTWTMTDLNPQVALGCIYPYASYCSAGVNSAFDGLIDEVKVFDYALTSDQIKVEYNYGSGTIIGSNKIGVTEPLVYWKIDENYSTTLNNSGSLGSPQNATLGPGDSAPTWTSGRQKQALLFDGTNDYASTPTSSSLDITASGLTYSAWINGNNFSSQSYNMIMGRYIPYFSVRNTGKLYFSFHDGTQRNITSDTTLQTGIWYYVVATYDSSGYVSLYINGRLDKSAGPYSTLTNYNHRFSIGTWQNAGTYFFNGYIDEVKVYSYPLSPEQIAINYNLGTAMSIGTSQSSIDVGSSNLVAWWKMDEGIGGTVFDFSGNNSNGNLLSDTGTPSWVSGKTGKGLSFDGNDGISTTYTSFPSSAFTISVWVNQNVGASSMAIGRLNGTWAASGNGVFNYVSSDSGFGIYGKWSGVATSYYATTTAHVDGNWHHLATTWDGSNITNYLDGLLQNIVGQTGSFSGTSDTLYIGRRQNPPAYYYGKLDNIKIFNTALTPAQIAWEYNQGAPIAHWRLDEKDGVIAYDASDNSNWGLLGAGDSSPALVSGKLNNSADFDGNDYISIGSTISSVQSISFWMKQDSTSQPALLQLSSSDYLRTAASSLSVFGFGTPTVYIDGIVSNYLADTNWHHISIISSSAITANQTFFGYTSGDNAFYSGLLDDIRFFNYPLTPDQIKNLYNGGASVKFN